MKRIITISMYGVLCLLLINRAYAQNVTVKGTVTDATTGETLIGVSVAVKSTQTGAQTGPDGTFTISAPSDGQLTFSYIGYTTQTVAINGRTTIDIKLATAANELQQVVVIGYGTQRKIDNTGAVISVKGEEISKQASVNPVSSLQGKVAGLQVTNAGSPGASPKVVIRGLGTIYGNTKLLYVVDGVWYDDISFLNPGDIDNISVLKDASSTAIYGIRAANGVVLVTTNRGKKGTVSINYNGYAGWQTVTNQIQMANGTEYATAINELNVSNGAAPLFADPASFGHGTDWYGQILRDAFVMKHEVSLSGGSEKSNYNISLGYLNQDGNVKGNNYKRYTLHLANDIMPMKNLKIGFTVNGLYSKSLDIPGGTFHEMYGAAPVVPVYYSDGSYGDPSDFKIGDGNNYNPQVSLDFYDQYSKNYKITGNVYAELKLLRNLTFKTSVGGEYGRGEVSNYTPVYTATLKQRATKSVLENNNIDTRNWIIENTLTYDNTFGDHHLTVLAGQTAQRNQTIHVQGRAEDVPPGAENRYLSLGSANRTVNDKFDDTFLRTVSSYFGRVNYVFKNRYLLNASLRGDATSQFIDADPLYRLLPSVGAGWVITEEPFMKNQNTFSTLKLRGSWGKVGNSGVPYNFARVAVDRSAGLGTIFGGIYYPGASINTVVPPFIVLELGVGTDVGLEVGLLNNRLTFEADYYNRTTQNAVFEIKIPGGPGTKSTAIIANQAEIQNRGWELSANWRDKTSGGFTYAIGANIAINNNKVTKVLSGENPIYSGGDGIANGQLATRTVVGRPIGEFFGYKVDGIFQTDAEAASSLQPSAKAGDFKFADTNGDGKLDSKDRVTLGNPNAKYSYGFNTSFGYKNFDLALDFQGVADVDIYNSNIAYRFGNENFTKDFYDNRWHGQGTSNTYPSANVGKTANAQPNSFYVESGSYFRVRNIQLGYTLPGSILTKWKIQRVRLYANAQNPMTFFGYKGFTPEIGGGALNSGIDANVYPLYATYNFGINVTF